MGSQLYFSIHVGGIEVREGLTSSTRRVYVVNIVSIGLSDLEYDLKASLMAKKTVKRVWAEVQPAASWME